MSAVAPITILVKNCDACRRGKSCRNRKKIYRPYYGINVPNECGNCACGPDHRLFLTPRWYRKRESGKNYFICRSCYLSQKFIVPWDAESINLHRICA